VSGVLFRTVRLTHLPVTCRLATAGRFPVDAGHHTWLHILPRIPTQHAPTISTGRRNPHARTTPPQQHMPADTRTAFRVGAFAPFDSPLPPVRAVRCAWTTTPVMVSTAQDVDPTPLAYAGPRQAGRHLALPRWRRCSSWFWFIRCYLFYTWLPLCAHTTAHLLHALPFALQHCALLGIPPSPPGLHPLPPHHPYAHHPTPTCAVPDGHFKAYHTLPQHPHRTPRFIILLSRTLTFLFLVGRDSARIVPSRTRLATQCIRHRLPVPTDVCAAAVSADNQRQQARLVCRRCDCNV